MLTRPLQRRMVYPVLHSSAWALTDSAGFLEMVEAADAEDVETLRRLRDEGRLVLLPLGTRCTVTAAYKAVEPWMIQIRVVSRGEYHGRRFFTVLAIFEERPAT